LTRRYVRTLVAFVVITIPNKSTLFGAKLELTPIVWAKVWPTGTTKTPYKSVVRFMTKETLKGCIRINDFIRKMIDKINHRKKSLIPKFKWGRCIGKERQTNLNNMYMFALSWAILLMSMGT
jgi:hypothetical protein